MKLKQTFCKNCKHYRHQQCALLRDTCIETELPCGKVEKKYPHKQEVLDLGGDIIDITVYNKAFGFYGLQHRNFIDSCTLNKGNCNFYKKKWYKFFARGSK
jgi:hypothetical protein